MLRNICVTKVDWTDTETLINNTQRRETSGTQRERGRQKPDGTELTPARGGSAQQLVSPRIPEGIPPIAGAFAVLLLGGGHDEGEEDGDEDGGRSSGSDDARNVPTRTARGFK